jgi:gliding motility-associated-like protein
MLLQWNFSKVTFLFLFFVNALVPAYSQQNGEAQLKADLTSPGERNILSGQEQWKEIESERTVYSSAYKTPDNRVIYEFSKEPLNYFKDHQLIPVHIAPVKSGNGLVASDQPNPITVSNEGEVVIGNDGPITYSSKCIINGIAATASPLMQDGITAVMKNIVPGIDKTFEFHFNAVEYNYVLNHALSLGSKDLVIEEKITLPKNSKLIPDVNFGKNGKDGWMGSLTIRSSDATEIGRIRGAVCFDASKKNCPAAYKIENINGITTLKIIIPNAWLSDPSRVYPVTIDPLVTGPTSTWGGSYIGSCLAPANNADSILVSIPPQISITGCFVSGSYYADPFTAALMSEGSMFFSTSCASSTSFTVAAPAGATPGTGYLTAFDLRSPLLCCKPQTCSAQTFYLLMHLSRTAGGAGCSSTYIYHDPFSGFPFKAYVEGHTIESYAAEWYVTPASICSNTCTLQGKVYVKYGVPPYTATHPWATGSFTFGTAAGCSASASNKQMTLTIPGCPWSCDTITVLTVPPPTVIDACGNILTGLPSKTISIKEVPVVTASPNPATACSGVPFSVNLNSCIAGSTFAWNGNGTSGTANTISGVVSNSTTSVSSTTYHVNATSNGCVSDSASVIVNTDPLPAANFSVSTPAIIDIPVSFTDNTTTVGGIVNGWYWSFGDNSFSFLQNPNHTYSVPGVYHVCMNMQTTDGCVDTICNDVNVIPATLMVPNIITPNGDGQNDYLYFKYLEYFGDNTLKVFDRWGKTVFEKANYANDWNGKNCSDGTYYFILITADGTNYPGYVEIVHDK